MNVAADGGADALDSARAACDDEAARRATQHRVWPLPSSVPVTAPPVAVLIELSRVLRASDAVTDRASLQPPALIVKVPAA